MSFSTTYATSPETQAQVAAVGAALQRAAIWKTHPDEATSTSVVGRLREQYAAACGRADIRFIDPTIGELHRRRNEYLVIRERVDRDEMDDVAYFRKYRRPRWVFGEFASSDEDVQVAREGEFWERRYGPTLDSAEASRLKHLSEAHALGVKLAEAQLKARTLLAEHVADEAKVLGQYVGPTAMSAYVDRDEDLQTLLGVPT